MSAFHIPSVVNCTFKLK